MSIARVHRSWQNDFVSRTAVAAHVALVARHRVLGGQDHGRILGDGEAIREYLVGTKCPAGTTLLLVADRLNEIAPLVTRVE